VTVWVQHIETSVPEYSYYQEYASEKMQEVYKEKREKRLIRAIYRNSGIEKRHTVVTTFEDGVADGFFKAGSNGDIYGPGTAERNDIFARESHPMAVDLARKVIANCPDISPNDITHVITASCTGFYNPGLDYHIVQELSLPYSTQRYHLGFMGCYAAFPALRMATQFCEANPDAVALVMCLELCSLHLQLNRGQDFLLANSLFADGAGAAIVSAREPDEDHSAYQIGDFNSTLVPSGKDDMTWSIGDTGFDISLSSYVPKIIGANVSQLIEPVLAKQNLNLEDVDTWAVHPGGKAIIDRVQERLSLSPEQVRASREVLRQYGNMSSATILFVLQEILRQPSELSSEKVFTMAFGPGITVETALLRAKRGKFSFEEKEIDEKITAAKA